MLGFQELEICWIKTTNNARRVNSVIIKSIQSNWNFRCKHRWLFENSQHKQQNTVDYLPLFQNSKKKFYLLVYACNELYFSALLSMFS